MIEVNSLTKRFGHKVAVDNVSFQVARGEVLGFLGPNGAGKSTTMRMITGFLPPTKGTISIDGTSAIDQAQLAKSKIGYLPESAPLYSDMSVSAFLGFAAELRGKSGAAKTRAVDRAIDICCLRSVREQSIETLSKGYKHRTCLAQSIIHDPDVLVLDEPTDGLDPNQKREVRELIRRMGEKKAIIFSTHILEEVEAACTRAIIIDQGRVTADGSPEELKSRASSAGSLCVNISGLAGSGIRQKLEGLSGVERVEEAKSNDVTFAGTVVPSKKSGGLPEAVFNLCKDQGLVLEELHVEEGRLDDLFRQLTVAETEQEGRRDAYRPSSDDGGDGEEEATEES